MFVVSRSNDLDNTMEDVIVGKIESVSHSLPDVQATVAQQCSRGPG